MESSEDMTPSAECDSTYIEHFAQKVLLWTAGKSQAEILQRLYQPKTKHFMFVTGEIPVDPTIAAMFLKGCSSKQKEPPLPQGNFLSASFKAALQTPPRAEEHCKAGLAECSLLPALY